MKETGWQLLPLRQGDSGAGYVPWLPRRAKRHWHEHPGKLNSEYPHDKATGYTLGMLRGAVSIKRPLAD